MKPEDLKFRMNFDPETKDLSKEVVKTMKLKDLYPGDEFILLFDPDKTIYIILPQTSKINKTVKCVNKNGTLYCEFPSDWECEKVSNETEKPELQERIDRLIRKMEINGYKGKDPLLPYSIDAFYMEDCNLFTRSDMVELLKDHAGLPESTILHNATMLVDNWIPTNREKGGEV